MTEPGAATGFSSNFLAAPLLAADTPLANPQPGRRVRSADTVRSSNPEIDKRRPGLYGFLRNRHCEWSACREWFVTHDDGSVACYDLDELSYVADEPPSLEGTGWGKGEPLAAEYERQVAHDRHAERVLEVAKHLLPKLAYFAGEPSNESKKVVVAVLMLSNELVTEWTRCYYPVPSPPAGP